MREAVNKRMCLATPEHKKVAATGEVAATETCLPRGAGPEARPSPLEFALP